MDQMSIALNTANLAYQQSLFFMQQIAEQNRQLSELVLRTFTLVPPTFDWSSDDQQSNDQALDSDLLNQIYELKNQGEKQLRNQCDISQTNRQRDNLIGSVIQIDGIYFVKDKVIPPIYIPRDSGQDQSSIERLLHFQSQQEKFEDCLEEQVKLEDSEIGDHSQEKQQIIRASSQSSLENYQYAQKPKSIRQKRINKREQQKGNKSNKNNHENLNKQYYPKMLRDQQCMYCKMSFFRFRLLLKHEAADHGIIRTREELFGDNLWDLVKKKQKQMQQNKVYDDSISE